MNYIISHPLGLYFISYKLEYQISSPSVVARQYNSIATAHSTVHMFRSPDMFNSPTLIALVWSL